MPKRRNPRTRLQIYFDIMKAIQEELTYGEIKPTRIQFQSNLSYDNLMQCFDELEKIAMISKNPILPTEKGKLFVQEYVKITEYLNNLGLITSNRGDLTS